MTQPPYEYVATYTAPVIEEGNIHRLKTFVHHYHSILEMRTDLLDRRFDHGWSKGIHFGTRMEGYRGIFAPTWPEVQVEHTDGRRLSNAEWDALMNGQAVVGLP